jgi:hypothetical protein
MTDSKHSKEQLGKLTEQINQDQKKEASAEKRVKVNASFKKLLRKWGKLHHPKKRIGSLFFDLVTSGI